MIYKQMNMICSAHRKRGEEVVEFNLSPHYFSHFKKKTLLYNGREINIVSEGWIKVEKYYYRELQTSEGIILTTTITYKIR
jgi:hypothetical protein